MDITEEVVRRRETLAIDNPESVYPEIRDLLERRMDFDHVKEVKYYQDIEAGTVRSQLTAEEAYDEDTEGKFNIYIVVTPSNEVEIQIKGKLVTEYEFPNRRETLWYYAYRTLYEKFIYGTVRQGYRPAVEEKTEETITRIRQSVEA